MLAQAVPIGININSPATWFVIGVACVVLALTLSTRRANSRPRPGFTAAPVASAPVAATPVAASGQTPHAREWTAAQALFVDDPRAGLERAQTIVTAALRDRRGAGLPNELAARYGAACAVAAGGAGTTEDLRRAFIDLRTILDELTRNG